MRDCRTIMKCLHPPALIATAACFAILSAQAAEVGEAQIRDYGAEWDAAFNAGDADKLSSFYAEDAIIVPPKREVVEGRAAIRDFWARLFEKGFTAHTIDLISTRDSGDRAIAVAKWTVEGPGEGGAKAQYNGQLVNVLQAQPDGQLRSLVHIWN